LLKLDSFSWATLEDKHSCTLEYKYGLPFSICTLLKMRKVR
jgi:hypothetical protein